MAYTTIDNPELYFQTKTYTGTGSSNAITLDASEDMQPDFVWIKNRTSSGGNVSNHMLFNSSVGIGTGANSPYLMTDSTAAEATNANGLQAVSSNGFTPGSMTRTNETGKNFVAWQWKCNGGTTTTNDASATSVGTIDSVYQANTTAGFSIVTWTGTGSNGTIAHGLGVVPQLIISKSRGHGENWAVYHQNSNSTPEDYYLALDDTRAATDSAVVWNDTAPTSSVISIGTQDKINKSGSTHIAYCFNEIKGYSKFGSYTGNGSTDGTFVYTGFKPAFVIAKRTDTAKNWYMFDNKRTPFNVIANLIAPNLSSAEDSGTGTYIDFLSNGFKLRQDFSHLNASGSTQIYMAFAEHPFVSSKGVPVTAR